MPHLTGQARQSNQPGPKLATTYVRTCVLPPLPLLALLLLRPLPLAPLPLLLLLLLLLLLPIPVSFFGSWGWGRLLANRFPVTSITAPPVTADMQVYQLWR